MQRVNRKLNLFELRDNNFPFYRTTGNLLHFFTRKLNRKAAMKAKIKIFLDV